MLSTDSDTMPDIGDSVDMPTFSQILEMDESEEDREFSKPLVFGFFDQAEETFAKMDAALAAKELDELSKLGHFLKGSSATLGFNKVRDSCQVIQQYGNKLNLDDTPEKDDEVCFGKISDALKTVKVDLADLRTALSKFFNVD